MSLRRLAGGALLATGLAATMCIGTYWTASAMQADLTNQARTTLAAQHLQATVAIAGRDAYVWADTPTARADAIAALRTIPGIRIVVVGEGTPPAAALPGATAATSASATATRTSLPTTTTTPTATAATSVTASSSDTATPTDTTTAPPPAPSVVATAAGVPATSVPTASASSSAPVAIPAWPAILFDGDSSTVTQAGKAELAQVAGFLAAHPTITAHLTGYTDTSGTAAGRQALGLSRASAVEAVLVADGVTASRMTVASGGGNDPVASSGTSQGRALNRRVTVTMTQES